MDVDKSYEYALPTHGFAAIMMLNNKDLESTPTKQIYLDAIRDVRDMGNIIPGTNIILWSIEQMETKIIPSIMNFNSHKDITDRNLSRHLIIPNDNPSNLNVIDPDVIYKYEVLDGAPKEIKDLYIVFIVLSNPYIEAHIDKYHAILPEILMRGYICKCIEQTKSP